MGLQLCPYLKNDSERSYLSRFVHHTTARALLLAAADCFLALPESLRELGDLRSLDILHFNLGL
jgi:hypothetical protein